MRIIGLATGATLGVFLAGGALAELTTSSARPSTAPEEVKGIGVDVRAFGVKCDGLTDDAAALNSAFAAASARRLRLRIPGALACVFKSTLHIPANVTLEGDGAPGGGGAWPNAGQLLQETPDIDGLSIEGSFVTLRNLAVDCGHGVSNTAGDCVKIAPSVRQILLDQLHLSNPHIGIFSTSGVLITLQNSYIYNPTPKTGECVKIDGGNDQVIHNTFCQGVQASQPRACLDIEATGALYMWRFSCLWGGNGKIYDPQPGEEVSWVWDDDGSYDSGAGSGILYQPSAGAVIKGVYENHTWTSTNAGRGVVFVAQAGATMNDIHFTDHRAYQNGMDGMLVGAGVTNLIVNGGSFCGNGVSAAATFQGVSFGADTHVSIVGVRSGSCAGFGSQQAYGIFGSSALANYLAIEDNDLTGNADGPVALTPPLAAVGVGDFTIANNLGVDDVIPTVASASTITAPLNSTFIVTGTTTVTTINGLWQGRKFTIIPAGALRFATGGNIEAGCTATPSTPIAGVASGAAAYLHC